MCAKAAAEYTGVRRRRGGDAEVQVPIPEVRAGLPHARVMLASSLGSGFEWYD
jgi:glutamate mutase epsilon subunit